MRRVFQVQLRVMNDMRLLLKLNAWGVPVKQARRLEAVLQARIIGAAEGEERYALVFEAERLGRAWEASEAVRAAR